MSEYRTRLKFRVDSVSKNEYATSVALRAVMDGSEENKEFWKYTPHGELSFSVTNEVAASKQFEPGQEWYVDLQRADPPSQEE